jgi:Protein of unknown function (DUF2892)
MAFCSVGFIGAPGELNFGLRPDAERWRPQTAIQGRFKADSSGRDCLRRSASKRGAQSGRRLICITFSACETPYLCRNAQLARKGGSTMRVNIGTADRVVRVAVGTVLIALAALGTIGPWGYVGLLPLATGLLRVCPAYSLLGISTCPLKSKA